MHGVDPIGEARVEFLHALGKKIIILPEGLALRLFVLCLVSFILKRNKFLIFIGLHLDCVVTSLLFLALLFLIASGVDW